MIEIKGNLWDHYGFDHDTRIAITVNGTIKKDGTAVMGRGCALEAAKKFPALPKVWGDILSFGQLKTEYVIRREFTLIMFPVKYEWWEKADLELIKASAEQLMKLIPDPILKTTKIVIPRPGCGNGGLRWEDVKPVIEPILVSDNIMVISK